MAARGCKIKKAEYQRRWRAANPDKQREYRKKYRPAANDAQKEWRAANVEKVKAYKLDYKLRNPEAGAEYSKRYRAEKPDNVKTAYRRWVLANQDRVNYLRAKRRAAQRQAMPKWLTLEQRNEIASFYTRARREGKQVDHIIPLTHRRVCGLHVPWNLQLLSKSENCRKYNTWE
jgi:hypothetical protein